MVVDEQADAAGAEQPPAPPTPSRRPFWPIALLLLLLIAVVLGAAFLLDQRFRPKAGIEPVAAPPVISEATRVPTGAVPTSVPVVVPTATTVAAPTAAPTLTAVPTATTVPTPVSSASAVTQARTETPAIHVTVQPGTSELKPLEREVAAAYVRYWEVLWRALYYLDDSRLMDVMAGAELASTEEDIRELRTQGRAAYLDVDLNFRVTRLTPDEAVIDDRYINRSLYVDGATRQMIPTKEPPGVIEISFQLRRIDGVWKVVDRNRHD